MAVDEKYFNDVKEALVHAIRLSGALAESSGSFVKIAETKDLSSEQKAELAEMLQEFLHDTGKTMEHILSLMVELEHP